MAVVLGMGVATSGHLNRVVMVSWRMYDIEDDATVNVVRSAQPFFLAFGTAYT